MTTCEHSILVVEDEPDLRATLKELLELQGFRVLTASNGKEALELIERQAQSCLIFLDLMMPIMDGWQFLEVLQSRHREVLEKVPIIVVSAAADLAMAEDLYGCGIMQKPVSLAALVSAADRHCPRHA